MELLFQGQYDRRTMQRALFSINQPSKKSMILRVGLLALFGIALIVALVEFLQNGGRSGVRAVRYVVSFAILAFILLRPYLSALRISAQFEERREGLAVINGYIDGRGVNFNPGPTEIFVGWERFVNWKLSDDLAVLVKDDGNIYPFPRDFFENQGDWDRFKSLLKDRTRKAS